MAKKWVLVVEDEIDLREIYSELLTESSPDISVILAANGAEAITKTKIQAFDCIITDLAMPKRSGAEFISLVRTSISNSKTPIVVISGNPDQSLHMKYDHLVMMTKPISEASLISTVHQQIALGKTDKRLPVEVVNAIVSGVRQTLNAVGIMTDTSENRIRQAQDRLRGDLMMAFRVRIENASFWFTIGVDKCFFVQEMTPKKITIEALFVTASRKATKTLLDEGTTISIGDNMLVNAAETPAESLTGYKGFGLELQSPNGSVYVELILGQEFVLAIKKV